MERRCTICRIVAWTAIALGILIVVLTLQKLGVARFARLRSDRRRDPHRCDVDFDCESALF